MDNDNWYRQLLALTLMSATRAAVEWLTNPGSREQATNQLREAFAEIDYDAVARAITQGIENLADTSKSTVDSAIDTLRDRGVEAVDEAKNRAEKQLAPKKSRKGRFIFGLLFGAVIAYFLLDEQRRDDLLDRLTGASGPIEQTTSSVYNQASSAAQSAASQAPEPVKDTAQQAADAAQQAADKT